MTGKWARMAGSLLGAAMLVSGAAAVAQNQPRYGDPRGIDRQDDNDAYQDDPSASPQRDDQGAAPEPNRPDEDFSDVVAADRPRGEANERADPQRRDWGRSTKPAEDEEFDGLTNDCAIAARDEAERDGGYAEVRQMEAPRENRNGFSIDGDVESRSSWRAQDGRLRHFTCTIANGRIQDVYFRQDRTVR